jgi:RHS repeat-associated protein
MLLPDTVLPTTTLLPDGTRISWDLSGEEMREACRALRGSILRQEVYALDGTDEADRPYTASERNYTIEVLQPQGPNKYGVFLSHARETLDYHYERKLFKVVGNTLADPSTPPANAQNAADPRVTHSLILSADPYGNILQSVTVGYGRRYLDSTLAPADQSKQNAILATYTESSFTGAVLADDAYRAPLPAQTSVYELIQFQPDGAQPSITNLFGFAETQSKVQQGGDGNHDILFENLNPVNLTAGQPYRRLIQRIRTLYRPNDMGSAAGDPKALLPLGTMQSLALPGSSYKLAFTPGLISQVFQRNAVALLPTPASVLGSAAADGGGYVDLDGDAHWWVPSGRMYCTPTPVTSQQEKARALQSFYLVSRFEDAFGNASSVGYDDPNFLLVASTLDPMGNTTTAAYDYRVLQPNLLTDPNGNQSAASFDALGLVAGTAVMGKTTEHLGDSLTGFAAELTEQQIDGFYGAADPHTLAGGLLQGATTRIVYDLDRFLNSRAAAPGDPTQWLPVFAATIARETHVSALAPNQQSNLQITFSYSDGYGREIQKKVQAEPGPVTDGGAVVNPRWVGSGWTIFNNKGKPVRQYEPFFSQLPQGHQFEYGSPIGVSPILCYDPIERVVATLHPNHTYEKVVFDPWHQQTWDVNDTVLETDPTADLDVGDFFKLLPAADYSPTWYTQRISGGLGAQEQDAATKAAAQANTPATSYFDNLGRTFLVVADNAAAGKYLTHVDLDIQNNQRSIIDALGRVAMTYDYDMQGARLHQESMEGGERWMLRDVLSKPIRNWDTRGFIRRFTYDGLRRDVELGVQASGGSEGVVRRIVYGESLSQPQVLNLRGRVAQKFDAAAVLTNQHFDFKGNILQSTRQFVKKYDQMVDWTTPEPLEDDVWSTTITYDALNRPTEITAPDASTIRPSYTESNLLQGLAVNLRGAATASDFVTGITYNARSQRENITYGNGAATDCTYDPLTFRLMRLQTLHGAEVLQDLRYTHDAIGNTSHVSDQAQETLFFKNQIVTPDTDFVYDALYRLIQATGREHIALASAPQSSWDDPFRTNLPHPNDGNAMQAYTEQYQYDSVGNFLHLLHTAPAGSWKRDYDYQEASLLEPGKTSNRLSSTLVMGATEPYTYDPHGNVTSMPHLASIGWDWADSMQWTQQQVVNAGTGIKTWYVYDPAGKRARKVTVGQNGVRSSERVYLNGLEVYREYASDGVTITLERQTLDIVDGNERVALVETRTSGQDSTAPQLVRYQFSNQLGSSLLELDDLGNVVTYEEYYPYGATSYQGVNSTLTPGAKRYRFTGKERDEESGFYYHGARYYAPWLGRWTSCDPRGLVDGVDLYEYALGNPIIFRDRNGREVSKADVNNLFKALGSVRARVMADVFVRFLNQREVQLFPLLSPFGYKGSRANPQDTLDDFDRAYRSWAKEYYAAPSGPSAGRAQPVDADKQARQQMWAAAAGSPIAAAVIVSGAFISATLGRIFGFEQDPTKAAAAGQGISHLVTAAGSLNAPHQVNEMVRQAPKEKDNIKEVEGPHVRQADPPPGGAPRNVNSGSPAVSNINCGQCVGAALEGRGSTSTGFGERGGGGEGLTTIANLRMQFQSAGNRVGPTLSPGSQVDLVRMAKTFPAGTNLVVYYSYPKSDGTEGAHYIGAMVGKGKEVVFFDPQMKPAQVVPGPIPGARNFAVFAVTPVER